jgi:UDP-2-acetamido-2,6-beta-L-arabino-hexul-4-ose reductase
MSKKTYVGVTGYSGFVGTSLINFLGLHSEIVCIPFEDNHFNDAHQLQEFVKQCDVIIHLAALNRDPNPQKIYDVNVKLVSLIIDACESTNAKPHLLFSSSTQENLDNLYGASKRDGRILFEQWAHKNNSQFTSLIIPNVFGPNCHPFYNSVVATFCHQLVKGETPEIKVDAEINLIYVYELVKKIYLLISDTQSSKETHFVKSILVDHQIKISVSEILRKLEIMDTDYKSKGVIPRIDSEFDKNLFNTFCSYIPYRHFPQKYIVMKDDRGWFTEVAKAETSGQFSCSYTKPGITRGNHYHTRKVERFSVIKGEAIIKLRKINTSEIVEYKIANNKPAYVDIPIWHTHSIENIGDQELITLFWINEQFNPDDPDTYFEEV